MEDVLPVLVILALLLTAADFDEVVTGLSIIPSCSTSKLAEVSSCSIAKLAVIQSLCDDAARVALNLRHRALAAYLRRAAELTPIALATTGARQRLAWGRLLQPIAPNNGATDCPTDIPCSTRIDTAALLSQDLIEMCGERVSTPWASATIAVEMVVDSQ